MKELMDHMAKPGRVEWVSRRPEKGGVVMTVDAIEVTLAGGIAGDHYHGKTGERQVTLIQQEHLDAVASIMGVDRIEPSLTRRNIVVSGINLISLKGKQFAIGEAILEGTGPCVPCRKMEANLGHGGYNAMRGHGGLCARVISPGEISIGAEVRLILP